MMASEVARTHSRADVALLFQMWTAGATIPEMAERFVRVVLPLYRALGVLD